MEERIFDSKLKQLGIVLTDKMKEQFDRYFELLVEWNKVMNLTGITEYEEVNEKHFLDSLAIVKYKIWSRSLRSLISGQGPDSRVSH